MITSTTISVILYKSKTLSTGEFPLMLRITKDRKRKYQSLKISCPEKWWDKAHELPNLKHPDRDKLISIIEKAKRPYQKKLIDFKDDEKEFSAETLHAMRNAKFICLLRAKPKGFR
jgi:hypothetical protein